MSKTSIPMPKTQRIKSQWHLLTQIRFAPFFLTQMTGAFNDSFLKQVVVLLATFHAGHYCSMESSQVAVLAAGIFILPFVFLSAYAGELADAFDKAAIIRWVKRAEVLIMGLASVGFFVQSLPILLWSIFCMGCHSAFFGPVKYAILPHVLKTEELTGGNGLVETGTFLSILGGTLVAGVLVAYTADPLWLSLAIFSVAFGGWVFSEWIPATGVADTQLKVRFSIMRSTWRSLKMAYAQGADIWHALLAISWFWFLASVILTQLPALVKEHLNGDTTVVSLLLVVFSTGVALGSMLCEPLSRNRVEIGVMPLGAMGLTLAVADFAWALSVFTSQSLDANALLGLSVIQKRPDDWWFFLHTSDSWRILMDLTLIGIMGGLYIVPLYTLIQSRTSSEHQARVMSANNILNAIFMVASALFVVILLTLADSIPFLLGCCASLNFFVFIVICWRRPEWIKSCYLWLRGKV